MEKFPRPAALVPEKVEFVRYSAAHERAKLVKDKKMKGRDLKDFIGGPVYTPEAVKDLQKQVEELEKVFAQQLEELDPDKRERVERSKLMAECLEGIFLYTKSWFGPTSHLFPTTKWDDYKHGVDMVAERRQGDLVNHHGFALDITYGGQKTVLKKMKRIADRIRTGKMGQVDFFKAGDGKYKGQLGDIPLVVTGADGNTMKELINIFAEGESSDRNLSDHPYQFQVIAGVIEQCDFYIEIAGQCTDVKRSAEIIRAYTDLKKNFEGILDLKTRLSPGIRRDFRDGFYENMLNSMEDIRKGE